ncbi:MAG: hypothetical protein KKA19_03705 [Candidatus Margulisbacteria bacterium]|nr:hypothetical protein [Candidatus Margulisiibacteriota bacterium]
MLVLIIGVAMLLGFIVGVYYGLRHQYTATEGTLALLCLEVLFVSIGLIIYGILNLA